MKKSTLKFIVFVVAVSAIFVMVRLTGLDEYVDQKRLSEWIDGFGPWGPLIFILIYSIAPSLMLPGLPITVLGGMLFGPLWGVVYVEIGATIGASIAFLFARYMGRGWVRDVIGEGRLRELDREVERQGWKIVAFTRLIPIFPFNLLNYAFGLTGIRFSHYVLSTFVFMLPGATAYVVFASSLLDLVKGRVSARFIIGVVLVVLVSLIPVIYRMRKRTAV